MIRVRFFCRKHNIPLSGHPQWLCVPSVEPDGIEMFVPSMSMMWCPADDAKFMDLTNCSETNWLAELAAKL